MLSAMATRGVEFWTVRLALPGATVRWAVRAEEEGWDGVGIGDSQNLAADPFAELALVAAATSRLRLATAVTNPVTRHPAVTAAAIVTVQAESGGRAGLGVGRGDSALAHLGMSPLPVGAFTHYLERLQGYLRGDEVAFDLATDGRGPVQSSDALHMAGGPSGSRLQWLRPDLAKVPVDEFATGPRVIAAAATLADRITFAVGADPARLRWAMDLARGARRAAGLEPDGQPMGVFLPVVVHPDRARARALISGGAASFARFSVMHGTVSGPVSDAQRRALEDVYAAYDMNSHFSAGSPQSAAVNDALIDGFAIAGPAPYCVERMSELAELGLDRIAVIAGVAGADPDEMRDSRRRLVAEVLPALR
jgi:5,10-methylenetetrahydromethanopterin reductase